MGWAAALVALFFVFLVQSTLVVALPEWVRPDGYLVAAVVLSLLMPVYDARLAAFLAGFLQDIESGDPTIGGRAVCFGLMAMLIGKLRVEVNLRVWWGRLTVALLGALPPYFLHLVFARFWQGAYPDASWLELILTALYAVAWAAVLATVATSTSLSKSALGRLAAGARH